MHVHVLHCIRLNNRSIPGIYTEAPATACENYSPGAD